MASGFGHFDASHRETFCAAVLLFVMEVDPDVKARVARLVRAALSLPEHAELVAMGREAMMVDSVEYEGGVRVDIWLRFRVGDELRDAIVEIKTHERWCVEQVIEQVQKQRRRGKLRGSRATVHGAVLLAPAAMCRMAAGRVPAITWLEVIDALRQSGPTSAVAKHAVQHLENNVERTIGLEGETLGDFALVARKVAVLRAFLQACIADIGGTDATRFNTTNGDGSPRRGGGWAWQGFSVTFTLRGERCRLGMYVFEEAPPGEVEAVPTGPWLEMYRGAGEEPVVVVRIDARSLGPAELQGAREVFARAVLGGAAGAGEAPAPASGGAS